ncbi:Enoyl-CoA hydratase [Indibacter alkaliphilus LW1]|uniref:Enoyl-CoA hydratase n=1 Tax=Indibacter alkaliphilus (strain CCUG 57479 / KCTC 22604 / LW1) TaxID=1189612 RepID=S2DHX0_INDAL|nr:enoyl-CoA hydratase/isomerase family protein [Indibacter alkaliphilus]EOZ96780.1 Enoyl-CoA hydratase [Indibacter alkaliphilus LW1]
MNKAVITSIKDRVGYITLNRPEKRNALNDEMVGELKQSLGDFENSSEVKVIVIRASGKVFCSGADLAYLQSLQTNTFEENLADSRSLKELFYRIYTSQKVIIAEVQGHALAGGCGLATVCDFSFAAEGAKFGYTEVKIGFVPAIVKVFLIRKIGEGKAKQLLLDGDLIEADEARAMGLVNWVVSPEDLEDKVFAYARKLIEQNSSQSLSLTKEMIGRVQEKSLEDGLDYAARMNAKARGSEDCQRGIAAFLNKEKLTW